MTQPSTILFVAESAHDLARLQPLVRALRGDGLRAAVHSFGPVPLGADEHHALADGAGLAAAVAAAERALAASAATVVAVVGDGTIALAAALAAGRLGLEVLRLDAGRRDGRRRTPAERQRTAIDHAGTRWFAATAAQATALLREGMPFDRVLTAGSLLTAALPAGARAGQVLLALGGDAARTTADAIASHCAAASLRLLRAPGDSGAPDPAALAGAAALLTDDGRWQEAAAIAGVPCVTVAGSTTHPETIDCGANRLAGTGPAAVARALQAALEAPRPWTPPYLADSLDRHRRAIAAALAAGDARAPAPPPPVHLPSDADHSGRTLGDEELELVARALRSGTLNSTKGTLVRELERSFARHAGREYAVACSSGSAAVHAAIHALELAAGDEVVTTPITDMGALTCILYQGGLPVFADVDPATLNVTAATIRAQITRRTRAIVVTHLFGRPCEMQPIVAVADEHGLPLIEDMAQAFGAAERSGRPGTFGALACYSLQQGKHMTCGEGGLVTTDDPALARAVTLFVNKGWNYGEPQPDHGFPAPNFRLTELQGAVALAQLRKLDWVVARRREVAASLSRGLAAVPGLQLPDDPPGGRHAWWKYAPLVDPAAVDGGVQELGKRLLLAGVACAPRYIQKPAFECRLFTDFGASPVTRMPLHFSDRAGSAMPLFHRRDYPGAVTGLERVLVLPVNELYGPEHIDHIVGTIAAAARSLAHA